MPDNRFNWTSLWNRDDCVHVLMYDGDCGVGDLCEQVHYSTNTIVSHTPVSRKAPEEKKCKKKTKHNNLSSNPDYRYFDP